MVRLDPLGGIAGDMFIAAATDAWPSLEGEITRTLAAFPFPSGCAPRFGRAHRSGLDARTFEFHVPPGAGQGTAEWSTLREQLGRAPLPHEIVRHAIGLYELLAAAEASAHAVAAEAAHFHEVGDWDSVADVLGAATVLSALPGVVWRTQPVPLGRGTVRTAHGELPVPAPAAAWLLRGLPCTDDGLTGERVTPTGAAILRYVSATDEILPPGLSLAGSGTGAGGRELMDRPNVLRILCFAPAARTGGDRITTIRFDVDDQSPEDLAIALEHLRNVPGVLDVLSWTGQGKKSRAVFCIQVLAASAQLDSVVRACLAETATLGVRWHEDLRALLPRTETVGDFRVKRSVRPGGRLTSKVAAADIERLGGDFAQRRRARRRAEKDDPDE